MVSFCSALSVKPLLNRLWSPTYPFGATTLTVDEATTVAAWAVKTAWMRELTSGGRITPSQEMRTYLMTNLIPPAFTRVWIGLHRGRIDFHARLMRVQASHKDDEWNTDRFRDVTFCLHTFKGLSVLVRTDSDWGVPEANFPERHWRQLWPLTETVPWPPSQTLTDTDVATALIRFSEWLRMPTIDKFRRDPNGIQRRRRN